MVGQVYTDTFAISYFFSFILFIVIIGIVSVLNTIIGIALLSFAI